MIKLSIITTTYNRARLLENNFNSVLEQRFQEIEHIIVDNVSTDGTKELVSNYIKKAPYPVRYIREPDSGIYNAMNKGLKKAKGTWTHILNSDDKYYSNNALSNIFSSDISSYDLITSAIIVESHNKRQKIWKPKYIKKHQFYYFPHPGIIIKKSFYEKFGYYVERYRFVSDAIHNILFYKYAKYLIFDKPLVLMRDTGATSKMSPGFFIERMKVIIFFHKFPLVYKFKLISRMIISLLDYIAIISLRKILVILKIYKRIYKRITDIFDFKPYIRNINYYGYKLFYSKNYSIVERYLNEGAYEPKLCKSIEGKLNKINDNRVFLDVGANVGLICLYIISHVNKTKVYAFEPGKHQNMLLSKTIKYNNLDKKIVLDNLALSHKNGTAKFASHENKDTPGDGLLDTGRAGRTYYYKVRTITLDTWWNKERKPMVDVIKMDTEGAEGWILKGGKNLIKHCKPIIFLELWPENVSVYPYDCITIINLMNEYGYRLLTLKGEPVSKHNVYSFLGKEETYVAKPIL